MSKQAYLSRYLFIIRKLENRPGATFEQISDYLNRQMEYLQEVDDTLMIGFSKRTFQRDIREIRNIFGVDIEYSRADKGYYIKRNGNDHNKIRYMLESYEMFNAMNLSRGWSPYILHEQRRSEGIDNIFGILHAIKNNRVIRFRYHKFYEMESEDRTLEPYLLKEYRFRWYCLGRDPRDGVMKHFALDRLNQLDILPEQFARDKNFNAEEYYRNSFGIITNNSEEPEEVELAFTAFQGKYISTQKLHHTQRPLKHTKKEIVFSLRLHITHDFLQELMMYGSDVKVLKPARLARKLRLEHQKAARLYEG